MSGKIPVRGLNPHSAYRLTSALVVVALGIGSWMIWQSLSQTVITPVQNRNISTPVAELAKLQDKDTDQDGLSDYDELFRTKTSPYLSDSDSDGMSDGKEITQRTDPNCPSGQACSVASQVTANADGTVSADFLRQALKASGVPQTTLDGLSDEEILEIYGDISANTPITNVTSEANPTLESLESLSAAEIRSLLKEAGVDEQILRQVDDTTLRQIFKEAITSETQDQ